MCNLPIDRAYRTTWKVQETHKGHEVWRSPRAIMGIHGTRVGVDIDGCTGCLKCITVCPVAVFVEWTPESGQMKVDPIKETECLECLACELVCPVDVIHIVRTPSQDDTLSALLK